MAGRHLRVARRPLAPAPAPARGAGASAVVGRPAARPPARPSAAAAAAAGQAGPPVTAWPAGWQPSSLRTGDSACPHGSCGAAVPQAVRLEAEAGGEAVQGALPFQSAIVQLDDYLDLHIS